MVHGYDSINLDILWQVLTVDLPALIAMLAKIVPPDDVGN
ncbi:MAG: HepT-like ribonuclease domain-containing protein [Candidatus Binatia bacterium]